MALLTQDVEKKIIELLINEGLVDRELISEIQYQVESEGGVSLVKDLVNRGAINEGMVARATAAITGIPYVELRNISLDQEILSMIPGDVTARVLAVPLGEKDGLLNVAMAVGLTLVVIATDKKLPFYFKSAHVWMKDEILRMRDYAVATA
jgi:hypothetical protein